LFGLDQPNIILETVKPTEDRSPSECVLRLFESLGTRTTTRLAINFACESVYETDMLENKMNKFPIMNGQLTLVFKPFEIKTLRISFD